MVPFSVPSDSSSSSQNTQFHAVLSDSDFCSWLTGITDGDGTFSIVNQNGKWNLTFKISQSKYNLRLLYYIKKRLGVGSVNEEKNTEMANYRIRDRKVLKQVIFPIFDQFPLLTSKQFNYERFKKAYDILENPIITKFEKDDQIKGLLAMELPSDDISPVWNSITLPLKDANDAKKVISKPWLVGFVEAEGSFYLVQKDKDRIVHAFGITQKLDRIVLECIRLVLHISTKVKYKENHNYYILDTTNSRAIKNIAGYFSNTMKGMKAVEYRIWSRTLKHRGNLEELTKIRNQLRKLRTLRPNLSSFESSS